MGFRTFSRHYKADDLIKEIQEKNDRIDKFVIRHWQQIYKDATDCVDNLEKTLRESLLEQKTLSKFFEVLYKTMDINDQKAIKQLREYESDTIVWLEEQKNNHKEHKEINHIYSRLADRIKEAHLHIDIEETHRAMNRISNECFAERWLNPVENTLKTELVELRQIPIELSYFMDVEERHDFIRPYGNRMTVAWQALEREFFNITPGIIPYLKNAKAFDAFRARQISDREQAIERVRLQVVEILHNRHLIISECAVYEVDIPKGVKKFREHEFELTMLAAISDRYRKISSEIEAANLKRLWLECKFKT